MVQAAVAINKQTTAIGVVIRKVIVEQVVEERGVAIVRDALQYTTEVLYRVQAGRARMPRVGDYWYVDRSMGSWTFLAYIAKNDSDMTTYTESTNFDDAVTINGPLFANNEIVSESVYLVTRAHNYDTVFAANVTGDSSFRFKFSADGTLEWGPGDAATDTSLSRTAPGYLKTPGTFEAGQLNTNGIVASRNYPAGAWDATHFPVWTTSTGAHTPAYGNTALTFVWARTGRVIFAQLDLTFGSSANFGGGTTADNWRFSLPPAAQASATANCVGWAEVALSAGARCMARVLLATTGVFSFDICSGRVDGTAIANNGVVDALTPWTWVAGGTIRAEFRYQAATDG